MNIDLRFGKPFLPDCVIPAAGRSSRMVEWKPLLPWGTGTICSAVIDAALAGGCRPILVAGYRAEELSIVFIDRPEITVVVNQTWDRGMLGSILRGAALVDGPGFLVAPADMPMIPPAMFKAIAEEGYRRYESGEKPAAIFAARGDALGHPVWIPLQFMDDIKRLPENARLRDYLLTQEWMTVEAPTDAVLLDLDERQEYLEALEEAKLGTTPRSL